MVGITAALKLMGLNIRTTSHFLAPINGGIQNNKEFALYRESPLRDVPHYSKAS
jgi:hypothetical protein